VRISLIGIFSGLKDFGGCADTYNYISILLENGGGKTE
jgi:hypothetical protein